MSGDLAGGPGAPHHEEVLAACVAAVEVFDTTGGAVTYPLASAVAVDGEVLALCTSTLPLEHDPTAHPEILAIRDAARLRQSRYLTGAVLYSTVEPCPMCAAAAVWARMDGIVFGVSQDEVVSFAERGAAGDLTWRQIRLPAEVVLAAGEPRLWLAGGVLHERCRGLLDLTARRAARRPSVRDG